MVHIVSISEEWGDLCGCNPGMNVNYCRGYEEQSTSSVEPIIPIQSLPSTPARYRYLLAVDRRAVMDMNDSKGAQF